MDVKRVELKVFAMASLLAVPKDLPMVVNLAWIVGLSWVGL